MGFRKLYRDEEIPFAISEERVFAFLVRVYSRNVVDELMEEMKGLPGRKVCLAFAIYWFENGADVGGERRLPPVEAERR